MDFIKNFNNQHVTRFDRLCVMILILIGGCGITMTAVNDLYFHFTFNGMSISDYGLYLYKLPFVLLLLGFSYKTREEVPHISFAIFALSLFYIAMIPLNLLANGMQTTPFHPVDTFLIHMDDLLHFDTLSVLNWSHQYPTLIYILKKAYNTSLPQILAVPFILCIIDDRKGLQRFFTVGLMAYLICSLIYYFLPTTAPASQFHSALLPSNQHFIAERFYQVHHSLPVKAPYAGMVAFPSPHVIYALVILFATYQRKWLFYPLAILNAVLIASTVLLGWHYLMDVIASITIVSLLAIANEKIYIWLMADEKTKALFENKKPFALSNKEFKKNSPQQVTA